MLAYPGLNMYDVSLYIQLADRQGRIDTDDLDLDGLPWKFNKNEDGSLILSGEERLPTISIPV